MENQPGRLTVTAGPGTEVIPVVSKSGHWSAWEPESKSPPVDYGLVLCQSSLLDHPFSFELYCNAYAIGANTVNPRS